MSDTNICYCEYCVALRVSEPAPDVSLTIKPDKNWQAQVAEELRRMADRIEARESLCESTMTESGGVDAPRTTFVISHQPWKPGPNGDGIITGDNAGAG